MTYVKNLRKEKKAIKQDLVATFTNGLGKTHDWKYNNLKNDLPIPAIKEACELLTTLDIFEENGVKLFDSVVTAKIITTKETEIFDTTNEANKITDDSKSLCRGTNTAERTPAEHVQNTVVETAKAPADKLIRQQSLIQEPRKIKHEHTSFKDNTASAEPAFPPEYLQPPLLSAENTRTRQRLLSWLRGKKHRNKEGPPISEPFPKLNSALLK